jgi:hypothetical protein
VIACVSQALGKLIRAYANWFDELGTIPTRFLRLSLNCFPKRFSSGYSTKPTIIQQHLGISVPDWRTAAGFVFRLCLLRPLGHRETKFRNGGIHDEN